MFSEPKNRKHRRTITIPESAVEVLRQRRKLMRERGAQWDDEALDLRHGVRQTPRPPWPCAPPLRQVRQWPRSAETYALLECAMVICQDCSHLGLPALTVAHRAGTSIAMIDSTYRQHPPKGRRARVPRVLRGATAQHVEACLSHGSTTLLTRSTSAAMALKFTVRPAKRMSSVTGS